MLPKEFDCAPRTVVRQRSPSVDVRQGRKEHEHPRQLRLDRQNEFMHALKVTLLLAITLATMRGVSWLLGWMTFRFGKVSRIRSTLVGNALALGLFVAFLIWNLMPGEPFDIEATVFGVIVFGLYQLLDLKWCPWGRSPAKE
jgi:hypothetical protein